MEIVSEEDVRFDWYRKIVVDYHLLPFIFPSPHLYRSHSRSFGVNESRGDEGWIVIDAVNLFVINQREYNYFA